MKIEISYGKDKLGFDIPERNLAAVIRPGKSQPPLTDAQLAALLRNDNFARAVRDKYLCILLPDGTRDLPIETVLRELVDILKLPARIRFIICTGTHNAKTRQNDALCEKINSLMNAGAIKHFDIVAHDCEKAEFINAGTTRRQTPILYNAAIKDAEIFLALSDVKHHYFAGYSNPVKNIVPGVCAYKTVEKNHSLALDDNSRFGTHPWHLNKDLRTNPLAADQLEAMDKIIGTREFWAVAMISSNNKIKWLQFGKAKDVSASAFEKADEWNVYNVQPVERMIVSCGSSPNDIDLYIAQRALELTKQAILDGGEIIFAAECEQGVGAERTLPHFWNLLIRPLDEIFTKVKNEPYKLFSHKPLRFAQMIERLRRIWLYSKLPNEMTKAAHLHPAEDIQTIINNWLKEKPDVKILVVDSANKLALRA
jgi:nickel-dependent lactate racemase